MRFSKMFLYVTLAALTFWHATAMAQVAQDYTGKSGSMMTAIMSPNPFKPYIQKLTTPGGVNFIRDNVADHLHHHGLMMAVFVNGVDFWAETEACGSQKPAGEAAPIAAKAGLGKGIDRVGGFTLPLVWQKGSPELAEKRTVELLEMKEPAATLVRWQSQFSVPEGRKQSTLTGSHYTGLGMRFLASMDAVGTFFNADGVEGEIVRGEERNLKSTWCAYTADADGKPVTVAIFSHPGNIRPATFFTMAKGFAYMSATLNLHKEPLQIEAGKPVVLNYGVAAWDGKVDKQVIDNAYKQFLALPQIGQ